MVSATGMSKSMLSLSLTGSFITYGAGQIISGLCGDKFSPKKLVSIGLFVSVLMNILIPFCSNHYQMLFVWCINGFAQAFMWSPMVRLMTALFSDEDYKRVTVKVSFGSSLGTILVYLLSPIAITFFSWKFVFWFSAFCGVVMILIWNRFCIDVNVKKEITDTKSSSKGMSAIFSPVMIFIMITIVLHGMLRDGITTWMPSYISETYNMSNAVSILTGVVLPLFTMVCFEITSVLHRKKLRNPVLCAGAVFGVGMLASIGLMCISGKSAVLSILLSALLTGTMHGVIIVKSNLTMSTFLMLCVFHRQENSN